MTHGVRAVFKWDGFDATEIARRFGLPQVDLHAETDSTLDVAHALAERGAPAGTLVVADMQRAARGRLGRTWSSQPALGVWCTMIERPRDTKTLDVLSIRVGLLAAEALDRIAGDRVGLKWPNDLELRGAKLGGILSEARWSGSSLAWVAVGVGVNVSAPADVARATGLPASTKRIDVLSAIVRAIRSAAAATAELTIDELERYATRDVLKGRQITSPAVGRVTSLAASGALVVETARGAEQHRTGTIRFAEDQ